MELLCLICVTLTKILIWLMTVSVAGEIVLLVQHWMRSIFFNRSKKKRIPLEKKKEISEASTETKKLGEPAPENAKEPPLSQKAPKEVIPLLRKADSLIGRNEYTDAKKTLIHVLSLDADNVDASAHLAYTFLKTGEFKKAESLFKKVLEKKPKDASLLTNYALCIFEQRDPSRISISIDALKKATELDERNANRFSNLGQSLFFSGDTEGAIRAFEKAISLEPKNVEFQFYLADSLLVTQKFKEAKAIFQNILELYPLNKEAQKEIETLEKKGY